MRISDWSSDVCSSDLQAEAEARLSTARAQLAQGGTGEELGEALDSPVISQLRAQRARVSAEAAALSQRYGPGHPDLQRAQEQLRDLDKEINGEVRRRSEEHTSELQSLMRISYAVFCLKNKKP